MLINVDQKATRLKLKWQKLNSNEKKQRLRAIKLRKQAMIAKKWNNSSSYNEEEHFNSKTIQK